MAPTIYHLNCVRIETPIQANVCGHCLLIDEAGRLILIDTGIGLSDTQDPEGRIGKELINMVGYHLDESMTAIKQIEKLGLDPAMVTDCIITHLDNDHTGGLADFPLATVHLGAEEMENYESGNLRYLKMPLAHLPKIKTYNTNDTEWFGLQARKIAIGTETEIFLVPLFGHTLGHCGVALRVGDRWLFYIGDAYYLRIELTDKEHPVNQLAQMRADNNEMRLESLEKIRKLKAAHPEIEIYGYHDIDEFDYFENNLPHALVCKRFSEVNPDFEELVMLLNQELAIINGDKNDFFMQFNNIDQLRHIVIAYQSGRAVGCGAMKVYGDNMMEIKRMYVRQPKRGKGVASTILSELEKWAVESGSQRCILETHESMKDAIALYKKNQYAEIARYGQYKDEPNSVCFEKYL